MYRETKHGEDKIKCVVLPSYMYVQQLQYLDGDRAANMIWSTPCADTCRFVEVDDSSTAVVYCHPVHG